MPKLGEDGPVRTRYKFRGAVPPPLTRSVDLSCVKILATEWTLYVLFLFFEHLRRN